ncbi:zinc ribbon domain-containing protein [Streptomyces sp. KL116D]|uniref:zinc ribbon domain-containing protein n=1 Tax=Streptomyces sp. KL116D TaxID=3045152 RepID=UPI00355763B9
MAEGLFTESAERPQLIGSACGACGLVDFPAATHCLRCGPPTNRPSNSATAGRS